MYKIVFGIMLLNLLKSRIYLLEIIMIIYEEFYRGCKQNFEDDSWDGTGEELFIEEKF